MLKVVEEILPMISVVTGITLLFVLTEEKQEAPIAVSYTHLTLPTNREV